MLMIFLASRPKPCDESVISTAGQDQKCASSVLSSASSKASLIFPPEMVKTRISRCSMGLAVALRVGGMDSNGVPVTEDGNTLLLTGR
ncbi:hypothetical protein [Pseudarthrobacter sp. LT1]|uniref:hypothetical protein n=1 Tax=Pseudarthrobacter sp. LT1 TaxID=3111450 RepID=UPI002D76F057|nr:hypothetical protein [Pseudarthrobacter sp. LT1]WRT13164.1 hypothetical protein VIK36_17670 [Pseudarthrobacter sp. LT1]